MDRRVNQWSGSTASRFQGFKANVLSQDVADDSIKKVVRRLRVNVLLKM
jgi:hypothetical protein